MRYTKIQGRTLTMCCVIRRPEFRCEPKCRSCSVPTKQPLLVLPQAQNLKMCQPKGGTLGATTCLYPLQLHCTPVRAQFTPSKPLHGWSGALRLGRWWSSTSRALGTLSSLQREASLSALPAQSSTRLYPPNPFSQSSQHTSAVVFVAFEDFSAFFSPAVCCVEPFSPDNAMASQDTCLKSRQPKKGKHTHAHNSSLMATDHLNQRPVSFSASLVSAPLCIHS